MTPLFLAILLMPLSGISRATEQTTVAILSHPLLSVQVRAAGKEIWEPASDRQLLSAGDSVRTGGTASVALLFNDETRVALGEQAQVTVEAPSRRHEVRIERIEIASGTVEASLAHQPSLALELEARTAAGTVTASNRPASGTRFTVIAHTADHVRVQNNEGEVRVARDGESKPLPPRKTVDLSAKKAH